MVLLLYGGLCDNVGHDDNDGDEDVKGMLMLTTNDEDCNGNGMLRIQCFEPPSPEPFD